MTVDPAPAQDTPTTPTPVDTPTPGTDTQPEAQTNWEDRYKEAQAWGTRNAQRVSQLEAYEQLITAWQSDDVQAQRWAAQQLGIQLADDDEPDTPNGGDPELMRRLEALEVREATQKQEAQQAADYDTYRQWTDPQLNKMGIPDAWHDVVAMTASELPLLHTPQGEVPDLQGAWEQCKSLLLAGSQLDDVRNAVLRDYRETKRAPHLSSGGQDTESRPDLDDRSARREWMAQRLMDLEG